MDVGATHALLQLSGHASLFFPKRQLSAPAGGGGRELRRRGESSGTGERERERERRINNKQTTKK